MTKRIVGRLGRLIGTVAVAWACGLSGSAAEDAPYPSRPVRVVVPFAAGAGTDILARLAAEDLSRRLDQRFYAENVVGAGGAIGAAQVVRSPADGYTLLAGTPGTVTTGAYILQNMNYDPVKDLQPISLIAEGPGLLVVPKDSRFNSVEDILREARARPGALNFGSSGIGAFSHYSGELFKSLAGIQATHVAFRGAAPALVDLVAGRLDYMIEYFPAVQAFVDSGQLRAIGITSPARYPIRPDIPTIGEQGLPSYASSAWVGLMAPAGTPKRVVDKLRAALAEAVGAPALAERLRTLGVVPGGQTPEAFASYLEAERAQVKALVQAGGMKAN